MPRWRARCARGPASRARRTARGALTVVTAAGVAYLVFLAAGASTTSASRWRTSVGLAAQPAAPAELAAACEELVALAEVLRSAVPEREGIARLAAGPRSALARAHLGFDAVAPAWPVLAGPHRRARRPLVAAAGAPRDLGDLRALHRRAARERDAAGVDGAVHGRPRDGAPAGLRPRGRGQLPRLRDRDASPRSRGPLLRGDGGEPVRDERAAPPGPGGGGPGEARRGPGARRDLAALEAWRQRYVGRAAAVHQRVNDAYLRAQGQADGVQSYGRMVDLILAERRAAGTLAPGVLTQKSPNIENGEAPGPTRRDEGADR